MKSLKGMLTLAAMIGLVVSFSAPRACRAAEAGKGVEFYLLDDETMDFESARAQPLKELKLKPTPWIAADNIERYDWSTHYVYLKKAIDVPNEKGARYVNLHGKPFVVTADGQPCYLGALWSHVSSLIPMGSAALVYAWGDKIQRFNIKLFTALHKGETAKEMRDNAVVKKTLTRDGLFRRGLECTLDGVIAERKEKTLALVYTYTLYNRDQDDLYVLDPKKVHPAIFHDYNNGVAAQCLEDGQYIRWPNPRNGEPEYAVNRDLSWYTRLESGKSVARTVKMDLTPPSPPKPGKYKFLFQFNGEEPSFNPTGNESGNDNDRLLLKNNQATTDAKAADGRIWLGQISAELSKEVK